MAHSNRARRSHAYTHTHVTCTRQVSVGGGTARRERVRRYGVRLRETKTFKLKPTSEADLKNSFKAHSRKRADIAPVMCDVAQEDKAQIVCYSDSLRRAG